MADIVFIPGLWHSPESILPLREFFENEGHDFHVPPIRGHRSLKRRVRTVEAFILNEQFEQPPIVIGHGLGGLIAQLISAEVETGPIILVNAPAPGGETISGTWTNGLRMLFFAAPSRIATPVAGWKQSCLELTIESLTRPASFRVDPKTLAGPLLVLSGTQDNLIPLRNAIDLYQFYPQAEFHGFADHGHWMLEDSRSEHVFFAMKEWLDSLETDELAVVKESSQAHHARPSLYPAVKKAAASKRSRPLPVSHFPGRTRHRAEADQGTVLPR